MTDPFFSIHFLYRRHISLKKIILALFSCVFIFSAAGNTFAHTHLTSTNPADGETITEPLTEITLTFEGQIEQGSTLELTDADNEAVELKGISVADGVITGTLENPLDNGSYLVKWSSISADGHPLEGEFTFAVSSAAEETTEQSDATEDEAAPLAEEKDEEKAEKSSFTMIMVGIVVVLVLLMAVSFFFLMRRKK